MEREAYEKAIKNEFKFNYSHTEVDSVQFTDELGRRRCISKVTTINNLTVSECAALTIAKF